MPGTIIFKPIQANLTHNTSHIVEMDPYCQITLGSKQVKGEACHRGGKSPHWNDCITLQTIEEPKCLIEIKDKGTLMSDSDIGSCEIDLKEIEKQGQVLRWYTLQFNEKPAGEILLEATFKASPTSDIIHSNIETQMGLGLAGLANPHLGELAGVNNPLPVKLSGIANPHRSESVQQPIEKGTQQNDIDLGWPEHKKHASVPAHINQAFIRSNDLDVPNNRDQLTRPDQDLTAYLQNQKEEHVTNFSSEVIDQHLGRVFSHQPLENTTPLHEGHKDKDWYHCDQKENKGLDLTSEFGPHKTGYDKDLWKLPDNLKDVKEKPTSK